MFFVILATAFSLKKNFYSKENITELVSNNTYVAVFNLNVTEESTKNLKTIFKMAKKIFKKMSTAKVVIAVCADSEKETGELQFYVNGTIAQSVEMEKLEKNQLIEILKAEQILKEKKEKTEFNENVEKEEENDEFKQKKNEINQKIKELKQQKKELKKQKKEQEKKAKEEAEAKKEEAEAPKEEASQEKETAQEEVKTEEPSTKEL
ncbi:hypothetical protein GPJ56_007363 [Histomonas meleagridis]|uniref:uncharacterized protein n=1 Tax=Histomonas meleagridis TaxID=135588 RepID=UPI003559E785|nr:hypothetical protein GPJ56_007363 [Histomonas meleagridis]KAH0804209.1 hypothetical protein GO595_003039 [Histomonas meleagridis]